MHRSAYVCVLSVLSLVGVLGSGFAAATPGQQGPSSSQPPYVLPLVPGVVTNAVLSVGDSADNGYRLVGKPDGLGAFDNGDGTFTLLVDHELPDRRGVVRDHGQTGAFVSRWTVDSETLRVIEGDDLIQRVYALDAAGAWAPLSTRLDSLCSADLPGPEAFYDAATGTGTHARLFLNGEENGAGRAFAHVVTGPDAGSTYLLASLGRASWENQVTLPGTGRDTVVIGTDDSTTGQIYVYVGEKQATGNDVERAGLVGGTLYGVRIEGVTTESDDTDVPAPGVSFDLIEIPGADAMRAAELQRASVALGVSTMARPEDSVADLTSTGSFYAATTGGFVANSHLWHLTFTDLGDPAQGGQAYIALASPEYDETAVAGPRGMENLTMNPRGQVLIQEDGGAQPYLTGIYVYDPRTGALKRIAAHDPERFLLESPQQPLFLTQQEESSGIIPAPFLGAGKYLLTSQAHYPTGDVETFEGGQLLVMKVPPGRPVG